MAEADTLPPAVDQGARAVQAESEVTIRTEDDVVSEMKRQLEELEANDRKLREERDSARTQADAERRAREAAEARAMAASRSAEETKTSSAATVDDAQLAAISNSIAAHSEQMKGLKTQYKEAFAAGDADALGDIQEKIGRLTAEQVTLENGKAEIEGRKAGRNAEVTNGDVRREGAPPDPMVARENWIRSQTAPVQAWLRTDEGARFFADEGFRNRATSTANYLQNVKGLDPNSQAYIDAVREDLGLKQRQQAEPEPLPTRDRQNGETRARGREAEDRNDTRMVTAPAGGSNQGTPRTNRNEVYLTAEEKAQARRDGISEPEYAKAKMDLINEGLIGPSARSR